MDPRNIIRAGIAASAALHLSFLALALFFSEVRPFSPVTAENVAVDIVTPDQVPDKAPEPTPPPQPQTSDAFDLSSKPAPDSSPPNSSPPSAPQQPAPQPPAAQPPTAAPAAAAQPAASQPQPPTQPQRQAALTPPNPISKPVSEPVPSPVPAPNEQPAAQPQALAPVQSPPPAYVQPQPDISVKYHVLLGLPQDRPGDAFDAPAIENADIDASSIAEFRRHLKSCSTLPKLIAPTDDLAIKLRVKLTRDGRLAAEPLLIEAKASLKGPLLIQAAIGALQSCQPYAMLPADKYNEWKVLDLSFTPRDFGAS